MRSAVVHLVPESPGQREAAELLKRVGGGLTHDPALTEALQVFLETVAAGHTVRITEEHDFYTPAEAGRLLGVSRQYVDKLIARGDLAVTRKPGSTHRLIAAADIDAMRAEQDRRRLGVDSMIDTLLDGGAEY